MSILRRALVPLAFASVGVLVTASPALALVQKTGGAVSCPAGKVVQIDAYGSGVINFFWPSSSLKGTDDHHGDIYVSSRNTGTSYISSWKVTSTQYLYDPGTLAKCVPQAR